MIIYDPNNPSSVAAYKQLAEHLDGVELPEALAVVIGGDGFMLHCAARHGLDLTYLGLNAGHLGFLLNEIDDFEAIAERLATGAWVERSFPLLQAAVETVAGDNLLKFAINDVYLERMTGQTTCLTLTIDGEEVVDGLVSDGIIFCTALGSTAYSFSAGGTPCHPEVPILGVTPICPHQPRLTPFVLPETARAKVQVQQPNKRPVRCVIDGRDTASVSSVEVGISRRKVRFAYFEGRNLTSTMLSKIVRQR